MIYGITYFDRELLFADFMFIILKSFETAQLHTIHISENLQFYIKINDFN